MLSPRNTGTNRISCLEYFFKLYFCDAETVFFYTFFLLKKLNEDNKKDHQKAVNVCVCRIIFFKGFRGRPPPPP